MSTFRKGSALVVLIAIVSLVAAMSAFGGSSSTDATTVAVTLGKPSEFKITVSKKTIGKGVTTFKVTNKGAHQPRLQDRRQEDAHAEDGQDRDAEGRSLKTGKYAFLCTVPGHAAAGMKGTLTVK